MTALVTPTVNLNGSSKHDLVRQCMTVMHALEEAERAIAAAMPHGRDFQTHGAGLSGTVTANAREAFCERARILHAMCSEFGELAIAINSQER